MGWGKGGVPRFASSTSHRGYPLGTRQNPNRRVQHQKPPPSRVNQVTCSATLKTRESSGVRDSRRTALPRGSLPQVLWRWIQFPRCLRPVIFSLPHWVLLRTLPGGGGGLVTKSCLTLVTPWTVQPARLLCPCFFPGKNTGVGCYFLLQGLFLVAHRSLSQVRFQCKGFWEIAWCLLLFAPHQNFGSSLLVPCSLSRPSHMR